MEIVLYVPKVPLLMVNRQGKESAALTINHNRLIILVQGPNATMQDSMSYLLPFFAKHGLVGLKKDDIDYWLQGVAMSYLAQAQSEIGEAREWLLQLPTDISITRDVAERWMQTVKTLDEATKLAETKQWILAVELLEQALQRLNDLQSDPTLIPPLSLQMDHSLAIFAPILFPLLLPMLAGLAREYKRYRTL